ncbi:hypothetical protein I4U23_019543 [Adineta vaga]|nr:hypothetical protein I4U23_019543 [Adineta vaga]
MTYDDDDDDDNNNACLLFIVTYSELEDVREHDRQVTEEAEIAQRDLKQALLESQKNASLLTEYHELYDLQRKRLEKQTNVVAEEKELWRDAAQTIALKIVVEHKLTISKRLNLAEQAWYALANHFGIYLMDKDAIDLTDVQKAANTWREIIETFDREQQQREYETSKNLNRLVHSIEILRNTFRQNHLDADGKITHIPDPKKTIEYLTQTRIWEELCTHEVERFGGDTILVNEERMKKADRNLKRWIDMTERLLNRHPSSNTGDNIEQETLKDLFDCIYLLHSQYRIRMTGENGLAQAIIFFTNVLETWNSKLNTYAYGGGKLNEAAWHAFYAQMEEWFDAINKSMTYIGKSIRFGEIADSGKKKGETKRIVDPVSVLQQANKGLVSLRHYIESHNSRISDRTLQLDSKMVHWLIQILIGLAPNPPTLSAEALEHFEANRIPTVNLIKTQKVLCEEITFMTGYIIKCCTALTAEEAINKRLEERNGPEIEDECNDWVYASKVILAELTGDESLVDIPPPTREVPKTLTKDELTSSEVPSEKSKIEEEVEKEMQGVKTSESDTVSYEAINRGGLTERRHLGRISDNNETTSNGSKSAQVGFDALRTIAQLQQQLAETEARAASLQEQTITFDVALREANQRIQQLESNQRAQHE